MSEKLVCVVCGRKFSVGQGILISFGKSTYNFHSKTCALKFVKKILENLEPSELEKTADKVAEEYSKILKEKAERTAKKIT
ncbi:MAG: hypothetical protein QN229_07195 [Desulfurococcaceae archaeon TW002]